MGKQGAQGGRWERMTCDRAEKRSIPAGRLPKRGVKDEPDTWYGDIPIGIESARASIKVVFWKRLVKSGKSKRVPDGEPDVAVLSVNDFMMLYEMASLYMGDAMLPVLAQNKARENLNVTRTLANLRKGAENYFNGGRRNGNAR